MKKNLLIKSLLLLCALIVGSGTMWATDPELTLAFTSAWTAGDNNSDGEKVFTKTIGETTYTISGKGGTNFKFNGDYFIFGKTNAYINLPKVNFDVEKIEVVGNSNASPSVVHNIFVGNDAASTAITGMQGTSSFVIGTNYQAANTQYILKVTSNHNAQVTYIKYYKKTSGGVISPTITANNVEITYDATGGYISYTLNNEPTPVGTLTASVSDGNWVTLGTIGETIPFTCEANETTTARTATITLTYTYGDNQTVTKDVIVTQAAGPLVYRTIPDLFNAATSSGTNVNVSFGNWVVSGVTSNQKTAYVTDNSGNGFIIFTNNHGFAVNDKLSGTVNETPLKLFKGAAEFTNLTASTSGLTVSKDGEITIITDKAIADLGGVNTGSVISLNNLTFDGTYLSDGTNAIKPYSTLYNYSGTFVSGKTYNVTGVYLQYDETKEILPRSADDIVEVVSAETTLTVDADDKTISVDASGSITNHEQQSIKVYYANFNAQPETIGVVYCDENGDELAAGYNWITLIEKTEVTDDYFTMGCEFAPNAESTPRTAYVKIYAANGNDNIYTDLITITQDGFVIDYAELPFNWEGGSKNSFMALSGVTASGLGSDYTSHNPYCIKLDGTGDYIQIKTNSQPDVVAIGVKMIGGSSTSTITVQGSADGTTFTDVEKLTISGSQNDILELETTKAFAATDRYVRLYFNKGDNIGVGPITIMSTEPSIRVKTTAVEVSAEETDETLEVITKAIATELDAVWYTDATAATTTNQPQWITLSLSPTGSENVGLMISANEGAARTAYLKIHGKDNDGNDVYSELVTVAQAEYVIDYAELPFAWDNNTTPTGVRNSGVSSYSSSPYLKFDATGDYIILKVNDTPEWLSFDIQGNNFSGGKFTVQTSVDGKTYTDLATYTVLGDKQNISFNNLGNIRYIKWIYTEKSLGNVALGNILVTKTKSVSVTSAGLATYCSTEALDFSNVEGLTAYKATLSGTELSFEKVTTVPAGTGVLLKGNEGTYQIPVIASAKTIENNVLVGVTESTGKSAGIFVLMNGDKGVGFYKTTKAFTVGANTAYIDDSSLPANVRFIGFDGETTGITTMTEMKTNGSIYNLNGQRVTTPKKGLYIMNGKKVVNK